MAHWTGGGGYRPQRPWSATVGQAGGSAGVAKHQGEASMNMSRWASAALAKCSLEIDSLAYRGLLATPEDHAVEPGVRKDLGTRPTSAGGHSTVRS